MTEDRTTQQALSESEARFRELVSSINEVFFIVSNDWKTLHYCSPAFERIWGVSRDLINPTPRRIFETIVEDDVQALHDMVNRRVAGQFTSSNEFEFRIRTADEGIRWIRCKLHPIPENDGSSTRLAGIAEDVTQRRSDEHDLRLRNFCVEAAADPMCTIAPDGRFATVNAAACEMLGYSRDELLRMKVADINPRFQEGWAEHWSELRRLGTMVFETTNVTRSGETREVEVSSAYFEFSGVEYVCASVKDVTRRNQVESQLQFTSLTVEHAVDGVLWRKPGGQIVYVNEALCASLGYSRSELTSMRLQDIDPNYNDDLLRRRTAELREAGFARLESTQRRRDGTVFPVEITARHHNVDGRELFCSFIRDMSTRIAAERRLRLTQATMDRAPDAVFWHDTEMQILYVNDQACESLGYARSELLKMSFCDIDLMAQREPQFLKDAIARISTKPEFNRESTHLRKDGSTFPVSVNGRLQSIGGEEFVLAIVRDLTETRRSQEQLASLSAQLAHSNRLGAMGEMASAMAHEMNQPLAAIANYAAALETVIKDEKPENPLAEHAAAAIREQAVKAGEIVHRMRGYVKDSPPQAEPEEIARVIREAVQLLEHQLQNASVNLRLDCAIDLPTIEVDSVQVRQVMVNLIRNAIEALEAVDGERRVEISARPAADECIEIVVADNGPGFIDAVSAFEPFQTTKANGMGMGLAISRTLIEGHGGRLFAEATDSGGALCRLILPIQGVAQ